MVDYFLALRVELHQLAVHHIVLNEVNACLAQSHLHRDKGTELVGNKSM